LAFDSVSVSSLNSCNEGNLNFREFQPKNLSKSLVGYSALYKAAIMHCKESNASG